MLTTLKTSLLTQVTPSVTSPTSLLMALCATVASYLLSALPAAHSYLLSASLSLKVATIALLTTQRLSEARSTIATTTGLLCRALPWQLLS